MDRIDHPLLVLTPKPWKWIKVLGIGLLFVVAGWWMAHHAAEPFKRAVGWASMVFFGLGVAVSIIQLIPGSGRLVATEQGLYVKTFQQERSYPWKEIDRFGVVEWSQWHGPFRQRHRLVGILFAAGSERLKRHTRMHALGARLMGYHATLPDTYGHTHQELADRLNAMLAQQRRSP